MSTTRMVRDSGRSRAVPCRDCGVASSAKCVTPSPDRFPFRDIYSDTRVHKSRQEDYLAARRAVPMHVGSTPFTPNTNAPETPA